jgi:hypothetical protein
MPPGGPLFSRPFFMLEAQRVSKSEFAGGALATPDNWLQAVLEYEHPSNASRYLINIGAHFTESDVVGRVMTLSETSGVAIDADDRITWAGANVHKHTGMLTPRNVNDVLNHANTPVRPLLLKVDIDSYDVDVALAVLHHRSPDFIFVEINEKIPPPVCYCNRYRHDREWKRLDGNAYGCSLQGFVLAFAPHSYRLVSVLLNDALFAHTRVLPHVPARDGLFLEPRAAFNSGYANVPSRAPAFAWNKGLDKWIDEARPFETRAEEIRSYYEPFVAKGAADFEKNATRWPCGV